MTTPAPASDADTAHQASYGSPEAQYGDFTTYNGYDSGTYDTGAHNSGHFSVDPLFGDMPGDGASAASTGSYDSTQWTTGSHQTLNYDPYAAQHHAAYDTGAYDATQWGGTEHQLLSVIPPQSGSTDHSGQWDASTWTQPDQRYVSDSSKVTGRQSPPSTRPGPMWSERAP